MLCPVSPPAQMAQCIHLNFTSNQAQANKHTRFFFPWFFLLFVFFFFFFFFCCAGILSSTNDNKSQKRQAKATKRQSDQARETNNPLFCCWSTFSFASPPTKQGIPPPCLQDKQVCCVWVCVCVCVCVVCGRCVCVGVVCCVGVEVCCGCG